MSGRFAVVIAGGGTGGHLYPGIAVARAIGRRVAGATVTFAGTGRGLEARIVPREGFDLDVIRSAGLKGKSLASRLRGAALIPLGLIDAWRLVSRRKPHAVVGVGGYSSGPVVVAAALRGVPTMVLEQNAVPGLTNRILSRWVRTAAVTYEETLPYFRGKGFVAGNPVREEFFTASAGHTSNFEVRTSTVSTLLVLGGSQGSHAVNMAVVGAVAALVRGGREFVLVHQTGERDLAGVRQAYQSANVGARCEAFLDPMASEMAAADLVVCRAGATTLAELAASGKPAVLIPFPAATDDHQRKNARVLADAGAAVVVSEDERDLLAERLAEAVSGVLADSARLAAMGRAMAGFARPDAADRIVDRLLVIAGAR